VKIIGFVIVMLMATPVFGAGPLSDEKQILKLEDDWGRALVTHDRDVLDRLVAPGFTFIQHFGMIRSRPRCWTDWRETRHCAHSLGDERYTRKSFATLGGGRKRSTLADLQPDRLLRTILFETRLKLRAEALIGGQKGERF
jgi:hypothetical protein